MEQWSYFQEEFFLKIMEIMEKEPQRGKRQAGPDSRLPDTLDAETQPDQHEV